MIRCKKDPNSILKFLNWILNSGYTPITLVNSNNFKVRLPSYLKFQGVVRLLFTPSAIGDLQIDCKSMRFFTAFNDESFKVEIPLESLIDIKAEENNQISLSSMYADSDTALHTISSMKDDITLPLLRDSSTLLYANYIHTLENKLENCKNYLDMYKNLISNVSGNKCSDFILLKVRPSIIDLEDQIFKYTIQDSRLVLLRLKYIYQDGSEHKKKILSQNDLSRKLVKQIIDEYTKYKNYVEQKLCIELFKLKLKYLTNSIAISNKPSIADIICVFKTLLNMLDNDYWRENTENFIFQIEKMKNSYIHNLVGNIGEVREANLLLNEIENRIATLSETAF